MCKWKNRTEVLNMSTEFRDEMVQTTSGRDTEKSIPKLITKYNKFIGGHLFQMVLVHSHLYNEYNQNKMFISSLDSAPQKRDKESC